MYFDEMIKLQALKLKAAHRMGPDLAEGSALQEALFAEGLEAGKLRNICAAISQELFDQIDGCCSMLDISKRRFVESALIDAVAKAGAVVAEVDPFDKEA